jgi:hypothetical protein
MREQEQDPTDDSVEPDEELLSFCHPSDALPLHEQFSVNNTPKQIRKQ